VPVIKVLALQTIYSLVLEAGTTSFTKVHCTARYQGSQHSIVSAGRHQSQTGIMFGDILCYALRVEKNTFKAYLPGAMNRGDRS